LLCPSNQDIGFAAILKLISLDLSQAFCHLIKTVEFPFDQLTCIQTTSFMAAFGKQVNNSGVTDAVKLIAEMCQNAERTDLEALEDIVFEGNRKHVRKALVAVVDYATQEQAYRDFIKNISAGGVFIETSEPVCIGQELSLTFGLPYHQTHIKITGEVVRISPQGIGVKFKAAKRHQDRGDKKVLSEKRRHKRFQLKVSAFALLNKPFSEMGEIIDISMGGLSFRYTSDRALPKGSLALDILCVDDGFHVAKVPVNTVAESVVSGEVRRRGVQFDRLTSRQLSQVRYFIRTYAEKGKIGSETTH
jgi:Tfp pilus assembly protein PilZ